MDYQALHMGWVKRCFETSYVCYDLYLPSDLFGFDRKEAKQIRLLLRVAGGVWNVVHKNITNPTNAMNNVIDLDVLLRFLELIDVPPTAAILSPVHVITDAGLNMEISLTPLIGAML